MDVKPLSKMSAGHKMDGHKNCQKCAGHEMDGHKHCQKCLQVIRWMDTNTVKSVCRSWDGWRQTVKSVQVMRWMDTKVSAGHKMDGRKHCQKCLQVMKWMKTNCQKCAGHEIDKHTVKCVCRSWDRWTRDRKVAGSNPSWSGGRIFFSRVNFLCWLLFWYPFYPRVTAVACKRPWSFC